MAESSVAAAARNANEGKANQPVYSRNRWRQGAVIVLKINRVYTGREAPDWLTFNPRITAVDMARAETVLHFWRFRRWSIVLPSPLLASIISWRTIYVSLETYLLPLRLPTFSL